MQSPIAPPRRNVEIKAFDPEPLRSLSVCAEIGAADRGVLFQRDTYFSVARGRLKLRLETPPGHAVLVQYDREDDVAARESRYRLVPVGDPEALSSALEAALGVLVVVEKERRLFLWEGVRIHLDRVRGLGTCIEFEAVAPAESDLSPERAKIARLRDAFAIRDDRLVATSYSSLLLARAREK
jgi:predicted adenylyl cyclase CyaB